MFYKNRQFNVPTSTTIQFEQGGENDAFANLQIVPIIIYGCRRERIDNGKLANVERVETIYDINDDSKNWGFEDGIQKDYISDKDFTRYKKVILYVEQTYEKGQCVIDLTYLTGSTNQYIGTNTYFSRLESGTLYNYTIYSAISANKTAIDISCDKIGSNGSSTTYGKVVKIKGVY